LDGAVEIEFVAVFPRPKRLLRKKDPESRLLHTSKPDIDNIEKCLLDALVMAGVLRDDKGVCDVRKKKRYSSKVEGPSVYFRLRQLDEESIDESRWFD
jgi:Holliday junction resolvase RusA-like endonuclease